MTDNWPDLEAQVRKMVADVGIIAASALCGDDVTASGIWRISEGRTKHPRRSTQRVLAKGVRAYNRLRKQTPGGEKTGA